MPFTHVLICCKVAIASGTLAGVLNTISQTLRPRHPQKLLWYGSESLQAFALGAALGTVASVPYLVYKKVPVFFAIKFSFAEIGNLF